MFSQFDYGRSLLKQVEAHRRLPATQQQKRLPALLKSYEQYATKLTGMVQQPSSSNPGQMKNAAEALVDVANILQEPGPAYRTFAEMAARSRKVPVVPGLAAMVDKLLEQPTDLKKERAILLSWRVVTGTMRPERYLKYLSERARLTDDVDDWKDLAWGASQLVKKGTVEAGDDMVFNALAELFANRKKLGEQALPVKLSLAESLFARKNFKQAETVLVESAVETKDPPEPLLELVEVLLNARPETCWELHQLVIARALKDYENGGIGWTMALEKLNRARLHQDNLVRWLLDQPLMPKEQRLSLFTVRCIRSLDPSEGQMLEAKWNTALRNAGTAAPEPDSSELEMPPMPTPSGLKESTEGRELPELIEYEVEFGSEPPAEAVEESAEEAQEETSAAKDEAAETEDEAAEAQIAQDEEVTAEEVEEVEEETSEEPSAAAEDEEEAELQLAALSETDEAVVAAAEDAREEPEELVLAEEPESAQADEEEALAAEDESEVLELLEQPAAEDTDEQPLAAELEDAGTELEDEPEADEKPQLPEEEPEAASLTEEEPEAEEAEDAQHDQHAEPQPEPVAAMAIAYLEEQEYAAAFNLVRSQEEGGPERAALLRDMEEWLVVQQEPTPEMMMALAQVQRAQSDDPAAGFEAATTAVLFAPGDKELVAAYESWREKIDPVRLHGQRARQAASLAVLDQRFELLDISLEETEELLACAQEEAGATPMEWLDQLRPLLDKVSGVQQAAVRYRWTRLYLTLMARSERKEQLPAALMTASTELAPEQALELVHMLEGELPAEARFTVECQSLLRKGSWQEAIELVQARSQDTQAPAPVSESLDLLFGHLPGDAIVPASQRIFGIFAEQNDQTSQLDFVRYLRHRFGGDGGPQPELDALLDQALARLCDAHFEPAVRYRVDQRRSESDPLQAAADLLQLVEQGDAEAAESLAGMLGQVLEHREHALLGQRCAAALATIQAAQNRSLAAQTIIRAGLKLGQYDWAQEQLAAIEAPMTDPDVVEGVGRLATARQDYELAADAAQRLSELGADAAAYELLETVLDARPESAGAHLAMLRVLLGRDLGDPATAMDHVLTLAQIEHTQQAGISERMARLIPLAQQMLAQRPQDLPTLLLLMSMNAACGQMEAAASHVQEIMKSGSQASAQLLGLYDRLALQDADLPSSMILAWGQALFNAGQVQAALLRLAGLRENVGDYPEYISLLEEIKSAGGGAGVNMQLAEAYLRVSLWQRAAGEYAAALEADPELAEPVLTQLRHHSALDPNPNKYPLHLVGLRAVAYSSRDADWGWALSALTWLIPRWSPEELYEVTQKLWAQAQRGEMPPEDRNAMLLCLCKLAGKTGDSYSALDYLVEAWAMVPQPTQEMLAALSEFDKGSIVADLQQAFKLRRLELEAAISFDDAQGVADAAQLLAGTGETGREIALESLRRFQQHAEDKLPVLLGRLKLLKVDTPAGREEFVSELLRAADAQLPAEQVRYLIHTVLDMVKEEPQAAEPQRLLLQLFRQLGDLSRAWQLALWHAGGKADPAPTAQEVARQVAQDEFALKQQIALAEILLIQDDPAAAMAQLEKLDPASLGELSANAALIGESLLASPVAEQARRWLVSWYRESGHPELAADHLVWAYAQGQQPPAAWVHDDRSAELLWRSGQIYEYAGNLEAAQRQYRKGREAKATDQLAAASIRLRLSELSELEGNLEEALLYCREAINCAVDNDALKLRADMLQRGIHLRQIEAARQREDNPQRTLEIARLQRLCGELAEAISELQNGIARGHEDPEVYIELAECFMEEGDNNLARRAFTGALAKLGEGKAAAELRLQALYGLATVEERLGNPDEAMHQLEQLLVIRHNYRDSRQRLENLSQAAKSPAQAAGPDITGDLLDEILSLLGDPEDSRP